MGKGYLHHHNMFEDNSSHKEIQNTMAPTNHALRGHERTVGEAPRTNKKKNSALAFWDRFQEDT
jgi:hypothetical protein